MDEQDGLGRDAEPGMRVRYRPGEHDDKVVAWGNNRDPAGVLSPDRDYYLARVEVHSWHTKVWLVGEPDLGPFNSLHFVAA